MKKHTIILLGHGSQLEYNKQLLFNLKHQLKAQSNYKNLKVAFLNINQPTLSMVINETIRDGTDSIIIVPIFIALGVHLLKDTPEILGLQENKRQGTVEWNGKFINIQILDPLGNDPRILQIVLDKINRIEVL